MMSQISDPLVSVSGCKQRAKFAVFTSLTAKLPLGIKSQTLEKEKLTGEL